MSVTILTKEDLQEFKVEMINEIKALLEQGPSKPRQWIKSNEVQKWLKISAGTLQTLRINGTLKHSKLGGLIFYDYEHIQDMLEKRK